MGAHATLEVIGGDVAICGGKDADAVEHGESATRDFETDVLALAEVAGAAEVITNIRAHGLDNVEDVVARGKLCGIEIDGGDGTFGEYEIAVVDEVDVKMAGVLGIVFVANHEFVLQTLIGAAAVALIDVFFFFLVVDPRADAVVIDVEIGFNATHADGGVGEEEFDRILLKIVGSIGCNNGDEVVVLAGLIDGLCAGSNCSEEGEGEGEYAVHVF